MNLDAHLKYLRYVLKHKWYVFVECFWLGIPLRGISHDLSKFSFREWFPYVRYFYALDRYPTADVVNSEFYNPTHKRSQEDIKEEFDVAWNHHQHHNEHHWQYWILHLDDGGTKVLPMPDKAIKEMVADWKGAGMAQGKPDTVGWYLANKDKMVLHDYTRARVLVLLGIVRE